VTLADRTAAGWKPFAKAVGAHSNCDASGALRSELVMVILAAMARSASPATANPVAGSKGPDQEPIERLESVLAPRSQDALLALECRAWTIALGASPDGTLFRPMADSWVCLPSRDVAGSTLAASNTPVWQDRLGGATLGVENHDVALPRFVLARDLSQSIGLPQLPAGAIIDSHAAPESVRFGAWALSSEASLHEDRP
jgi:hypothetical protein